MEIGMNEEVIRLKMLSALKFENWNVSRNFCKCVSSYHEEWPPQGQNVQMLFDK